MTESRDPILTYDEEVNAGYLRLHEGERSDRQVFASSRVIIDVAATGQMLGIEVLDGPVDMGAFWTVLRDPNVRYVDSSKGETVMHTATPEEEAEDQW